MKFLFIFLFAIPNAFALDQCFTYKIKEKLISEGQCQKRYPPQSTFKMTISMMGFDAKILKNAYHPVLPFKKGYTGAPDALGTAWITSSLKISPEEQVLFIEKFLDSKLGLQKEVNASVKDLLFVEDLGDGWKLYGKTGAGDLVNVDGNNNKTLERGWFSGWVENGKERIIFSQYFEIKNIKSKKNNFSYIASREAKKMAREKMIQIKNKKRPAFLQEQK